MMRISERGMALIRACEGFSPVIYICPAGKKTIGYGHAVREGERFPGGGISEEQAEALLNQDVEWAERAVDRRVSARLCQHQFDALVSLTYNIGADAFARSTLLKLVNQGDIAQAGQEFSRWVHAGGRKCDGLIKRRALELALFQGEAIGG